jgi:hypothetical protein
MFAHVLDRVGALAASIAGEDLSVGTPMPGASLGDVRAEVLRILTGSVEAAGGSPGRALRGGWADRWWRLRREFDRAVARPGTLDRPVPTASGPRPVRMYLIAQVPVLVLLGWDIAVVLGRTDDLDGDLTGLALAITVRAVPAGGRGQDPFLGPVRAVSGNASDGERLAAWVGHRAE